jgi:hypothetical protein
MDLFRARLGRRFHERKSSEEPTESGHHAALAQTHSTFSRSAPLLVNLPEKEAGDGVKGHGREDERSHLVEARECWLKRVMLDAS